MEAALCTSVRQAQRDGMTWEDYRGLPERIRDSILNEPWRIANTSVGASARTSVVVATSRKVAGSRREEVTELHQFTQSFRPH
jgi:hypothetical protein